jgi:hypothetical protein
MEEGIDLSGNAISSEIPPGRTSSVVWSLSLLELNDNP